MKSSWAVVATVDEPAALVAAFAAHHLAQGASEVFLFLDRPDAEAERLLAQLPNCHVTVCDDAYWLNLRPKGRPKQHPMRQIFNARSIYDRTSADWLLHCDADEYIRDPELMQQELDRAPAHLMYLRLQVAERAYPLGEIGSELFSGVFRYNLPNYWETAAPIYGDMMNFFHFGLTGHKAGKALVRTGFDQLMGIHGPEGRPRHRTIETMRLLHFDGLTRLHFCLKLLRRAHEGVHGGNDRHGPARSTQFLTLKDSVADAEMREALVSLLKNLDAAQMEKLQAMECFDGRSFDPQPAARAAGLALDLSVASFDAALKRRYADFLGQYAPDLL
jgi:hypothetical protein